MLKRDTLPPAVDSPNHADAPVVVMPDPITASELYQQRPPLDFVLPGLLAGTVASLVAPGAMGKSFLLLAIAIALVLGIPVAGGVFPAPRRGKVVLFAAEEQRGILLDRLEAHGVRPEIMTDLVVYPLAGHSPCLLTSKGVPFDAWVDAIIELCQGARLIIIDPLRRFHDSDENDSAHATRLVQTLEHIAQATGAAVLISHHANKSATLNGQGGEQGASRGASALTDALRWQANLVGMSEHEANTYGITPEERGEWVRLALSTAKNNYGRKAADVWMRRNEKGVLRLDYPDMQDLNMPPATQQPSANATPAQQSPNQVSGRQHAPTF